MGRLTIDTLIQKLKAADVKLTYQRQFILESILVYPGTHFSADQLFAFIHARDPGIGVATVFRTVILFEQVGIVNRVKFDSQVNMYEMTDPDNSHQHHHLICQACGKVIEMNVDWLDQLEETIRSSHNFLIKNHQLNFYGICSDCQEKNKR